ncbi:MAG: hypothetical protein GEV28_04330 [Actinophytocola sp.]|uniref:hypothetical protein n=1 Tax=Actinophytocola sp. TaxID=1872138 RepID=UPI001323790C|nr:hypothetical protein [Actinophytocola sp.]MPZ79651.1 hypothetical protein [Actinophytocola sp.]
MTPTPHGDCARHHRHHHRRPLRHDSIAPARTVHGRHGAVTPTPARRRAFSPRPATLWPFAGAEPLPGTARLAGWLGRVIVTLVTGYTRPGDRVLLLAPPAPPRGLTVGSAAPGGAREADPYAGLTEAVWTVIRLGRGADTATAAPTPDYRCDPADSTGRDETESGSRPRPSRLGLRTPTDRHRESESRPGRAAHRPDDRFDLIITAVHPHTADWLAHTDWDTALTPTGTLATITRSDIRGDRLLDPLSAIVGAVRSQRRGWLDHIAVLTDPLPAGPAGSSLATTSVAEPPLPRAVHHDLLLFGPVPSATPAPTGGHAGTVAAERGETSDE